MDEENKKTLFSSETVNRSILLRIDYHNWEWFFRVFRKIPFPSQ